MCPSVSYRGAAGLQSPTAHAGAEPVACHHAPHAGNSTLCPGTRAGDTGHAGPLDEQGPLPASPFFHVRYLSPAEELKDRKKVCAGTRHTGQGQAESTGQAVSIRPSC